MGSSYIDKFGYRRQRANPVSRIGVFPYTGEQIDQPKRDPVTGEPILKVDPMTGEVLFTKDADGNPVPQYEMQFGLEPKKLYPVLRGPEELFNPEAIESFNGVPIRVGHLMLGDEDKSKDGKKLVKADDQVDGCIYNVRPSLDEPGYLIAEFCIYSDRMKKVLKEGKIKELSLGYTCIYEPENGVFNGVPYMFKQTNLRGNHLALVKHGRCGSSVCVCDEAVVTFDSLPDEGESLMDETKKEEPKLNRAKALAARIRGGDEQLAQDCLDFADFPPESRKEALELIKGKKDKKDDGEKKVEDKSPKTTKDGEIPPAPPPPPTDDDKKSEAPAPAASAVEAPTQNPDDQKEPPPTEVPSPKEEDKIAGDKNPVAVCDKCGKPCADCCCGKEAAVPAKDCGDKEAKDCGDKEAKDCGTPPAEGATTPSVPTPVSAIQTMAKEEKKEEAPAKDCKDKAPEKVDVKIEKVEESKPGEAIAAVLEGQETEDQSAETRIKADVKAEHDNVPPGKTAKVAQDEYSAFVAEYTAAQALADKLRPYIKETFDSAPMREIDIARLAAKHINNLAFVADEADDEKVLLAVRGYAAAVAMDAAPVSIDKPASTKPDIVDTPPTAEAIVQDEAIQPDISHADVKGLSDYLTK